MNEKSAQKRQNESQRVDICIFYSKEDSPKVATVVKELARLGWDVWWDQEVVEGDWAQVAERAIEKAACVVPVWTATSVRSDRLVLNETKRARDTGKRILPLRLDNVPLPLEFNRDTPVDIIDWSGDIKDPRFQRFRLKLERLIGPPSKSSEVFRPPKRSFHDIEVTLPCFVRSVSSYEVQLKPDAALTALKIFPSADAVLVSAYDFYLKRNAEKKEVHEHKNLIRQVQDLSDRGSFILLDSGNYEATRNEDKTWTEKKFRQVLKEVPFTYAFCFDNLTPSAVPKKNALDAIKRADVIAEGRGIPIVHAPLARNGKRMPEVLPDVFYALASTKRTPIIAVPERELGEGVIERARVVYNIRQRLNNLGWYQPVHLLGTGNPVSIAIFAAAGADLFDGLEWCRTVADRDSGFLFHHQQYDFFRDQTRTKTRHDIVRDAEKNKGLSLMLKMALHNLDFLQYWMEEIQANVQNERMGQMLAFHLKIFFEKIREELPEICS